MVKYSVDLKLKIVHEYLERKEGTSYLAKKYDFKSNQPIQKWVNAYQEFGEEVLLQKRQNQSYSVQFKIETGNIS